ncbi:MAG TPA: M56 family metallopeptidase [Chthonomonadaceae bacterium]|nr:M56 family metallopeptidase [Chthonomonadaceae bacterium]
MPEAASLTLNWAAAIGRACWQGGLALLLAGLICRAFPRLSPRLQCWLWRLAYLKLLISLLCITPLNLPLLPPQPSSLLDSLPEPAPAVVSARPMGLSAAPAAFSSAFVIVTAVLFCLWLGGCIWRLRRFYGDWAHIQSLRRHSRAVTEASLLAVSRELCGQLGLSRCPELLLSEGQEGPLLIGLWRPAILLPEALWSACTPDQQRLILAHELAHLRRYDLLWAWVPGLNRCLFWFHPLVWLAEREWQQSQEMACDEQVLRLADASRSAYGEALLKVALQSGPALPSGLVALRVAESYTTVRRRLLAMKHAGNMSRRTLLAAGALVAALGLVGIIPWRVSAQDAAKKEGANSEIALSAGMFTEKAVKALGLSEEQTKQVHTLHEAALRQIRQILTPEQQQKLVVQMKLMAEKADVHEALMAKLELSDAQKQSLHDILSNSEHQMQAVKMDGTLSGQEKEAHMKAIAERQDQEIQQALTPDQRKKFAAARAQLETPQERDTFMQNLHLSEAQQQQLVDLKKGLRPQIEAIDRDASLSAAEKEARMNALKEQAHTQLLQVLTPVQQKLMAEHEQQLQTIQAGGFYGLAHLELLGNLTNAQKAQIQAIHADLQQKFQQILTPEQKLKWQHLQMATGEPHSH